MGLDLLMARALELAAHNAASGQGGPFGAVVALDGQLVADGVNIVTQTLDPTAHAEVVAVRRAAAKLGRFELSGCEIYTSCEPCPMCLAAIWWARIDRIWFAASQQEAAAAGFDDSVFYSELQRQPEQRRIPMQRLLGERAMEPFAAWANASVKVPY